MPAREFPVVFEDEQLLAIDKPAGVAVHGGSGVDFGVIEQLRRARPEARFLELVHRLDRETSGLLLLAKRRSALTALQEQFRDRATGKTYAALVAGGWPRSRRVIDVALHKYLDAAGERRVRAVADDHADGRRSISLVQVVAGLARLDAARRDHQDRPHAPDPRPPGARGPSDRRRPEVRRLRAQPVAGARHGGRRRRRLERMFLHARRLRFVHPADGRTIELEAPLPAECAAFLHALGAGATRPGRRAAMTASDSTPVSPPPAAST